MESAALLDISSSGNGNDATDTSNPEIIQAYSVEPQLAPRRNSANSVKNVKMGAESKLHGCCSNFGSLMNLCGDVMLAMLVTIRSTLLEADSSECLALLMHFSEANQLTLILQKVLKIRRGLPILDDDFSGGKVRRMSSKDSSGGQGIITKGTKRPSWLAATAAMSTPPL